MSATRLAVKQRFNIVGDHPKLNQAIDIAVQVAPTEVTVLVVGENGSGKDIFSKIIHAYSKRKHKPFIAINCGAIPEGTIDSELFGHEKGSFTSAYEARKGYFEEVNGGIIFLDEIAELPLSTQARLLRVLENGEYLRVGSSKVQKTDVRVIAATNKNLIEAIRQGKFREDLYFRLNTVTIAVPPLREREEDIALLFRYFATEFGQRYNIPPIQLSPEARQDLLNYHWPGNVRELRNFVEKVTVLSKEPVISGAAMRGFLPIQERLLPVAVSTTRIHEQPNQPPIEPTPPLAGENQELLIKMLYELKADVSVIKHALFSALQTRFQTQGMGMLPETTSFIHEQPRQVILTPIQQDNKPQQPAAEEDTLSLEQREKDLIAKALNKYQHNRKKAALELGISERTLYRKIKTFGLED